MKWEDEGYSRKDDEGNPISMVRLAIPFPSSFGMYSDLLEQEEYSQRATAKKHRFNLTKGDLRLFAITG